MMPRHRDVTFVLLVLAQLQQSKVEAKPRNIGRLVYEALQELVPFLGFLGDASYIVEQFRQLPVADTSDPKQLNAALKDISRRLDEMSETMLRFQREVIEKLDTIEEHSEMTNKLIDIYEHIDRMSYLYEHGYLNFIKNRKTYLNETKRNFAIKVLSFDHDGVNYPLEKIHKLFLETDTTEKNIPMYYAEDDDLSRSLMCRKKQSAQRLIYSIYELIAMTEMKGIVLLAFAHEVLLEFQSDPEIKTSELGNAKKYRKKRMKKTFVTVKRIAESASREIWPCDPKYHEIGKSYEKFGPIFQKYVMYEGDVVQLPTIASTYDYDRYDPEYPHSQSNWKLSLRSSLLCDSNCPSLTYANKQYCNSYLCNATPKKLLCNGRIHDCEYVDKYLHICFAEGDDYRRYRSIRTYDGRTFGEGETCPNTELTVYSGYEYGTFYNCDYCLCTCEDDSKKNINKYVNLLAVHSDVFDNKIVTGVQLVNVHNVFHIKIQQGTLLPKGHVDRKSVEWTNVSAYNVTNSKCKAGSEYQVVTWDQRAFFLDDLENYDGHVLTGIRFMVDDDKNIKLAIQTIPFDFETGILQTNESIWMDSSNLEETAEREELKLAKYEDPTHYPKHAPDSNSNQFIKLTTSDLEQDAAQTVVPFFDTQPVISSYPMPLSGVGLIHKGHDGSAGFLALKVFTFDITRLT